MTNETVENTLEAKQESDIKQESVNDQAKITPPEQAATETPEQEETKEDPNWRAFREARKKDRLEREAAEKRAKEKAEEAEALKAAMESILNKGGSNNQPQQRESYYENDYESEESEDAKIEKKIQAALEKQRLENERLREEQERQQYPQRLKSNFPDFDQVISQENLDYLDYHYPEIARPLGRAQENYDKWVDIYKAVKRFVPNTDRKRDIKKAEDNSQKPRSMSTASVTPSAQGGSPIHIDKERKQANWERMQRVLKGLTND